MVQLTQLQEHMGSQGHVHLATLLASKIRLVVNSFKLHLTASKTLRNV